MESMHDARQLDHRNVSSVTDPSQKSQSSAFSPPTILLRERLIKPRFVIISGSD